MTTTAPAWKTFSIGKNVTGMVRSTRSPHSPSVLLIDDEAEITTVLQLLLETCGHRVWVATDGKQGFELACHASPEVIFCDLDMPGMHGFELLRKLRESEATRRIPVILHTGSVDEDDKRTGLELGAASILQKPCSLEQVRRAITAQLEKSAAEPAAQGQNLLMSA